ncbi:MAG: hypothetical protein AB7O52_05920 [Planctomycetota bacterium]
MERDAQRSVVYRAEDTVDSGREFADLDAVQEFVDRVLASAYWERIPGAPQIVVVRDGRGRRHACANGAWFGAELRLPRWSRSARVVLHELAHTITAPDRAPHGPEFAARYVKLVERFLSWDHGCALRAAFRSAGVRIEGDDSP